MGKYFGTDGFRGKAGVDLTAEHAFQVGRFLGWYYSRKHAEDSARIVIGKDTRRSSYMFENALAAGITSSGGRISAPRYHHSLRQLHHPYGEFRLRRDDLRQPQSVL